MGKEPIAADLSSMIPGLQTHSHRVCYAFAWNGNSIRYGDRPVEAGPSPVGRKTRFPYNKVLRQYLWNPTVENTGIRMPYPSDATATCPKASST